MWYYLVRYSFDADKPVFGPFGSYLEAWEAALADAKREFDIDKNENGWEPDMAAHEEYGEIVIVNRFVDRDDTTEYLIFEI